MGTEKPRLTQQSLRVLKLFSENPSKPLAGADIMKATRLASGTLYPILLRFENYGLLDSKWETEEPTTLGRPRRRLYSLTLDGRAEAHAALAQLSSPSVPGDAARKLDQDAARKVIHRKGVHSTPI
jgi:PadR family transcriptional regulator PadR